MTLKEFLTNVSSKADITINYRGGLESTTKKKDIEKEFLSLEVVEVMFSMYCNDFVITVK